LTRRRWGRAQAASQIQTPGQAPYTNGQVALAPLMSEIAFMTDTHMKGALFVHMIGFAQQELGEITAERIIAALDLQSGGAYTAIGMYPLAEFGQLHDRFAAVMELEPAEFSRRLGHYALPILVAMRDTDTGTHIFDFLEQVHGVIHRDVRKLYKDASPPDVQVVARDGSDKLTLRYDSRRPMAAFCTGMLEGALRVFDPQGMYKMERVDPVPRRDNFAEFQLEWSCDNRN